MHDTIIVVCLGRLEAGSTPIRSYSFKSLSSFFRHEACGGGNLIKIHTDRCKSSSGGKRQCNVTVTGTDPVLDPTTRFTITKIRRKKCIQFTDELNGTKYGLKVSNSMDLTFHLTFEEHDGCTNATGDDFLFVERKGRKIFKYEHTVGRRRMCIGVARDCSKKTLHLLSQNNTEDRRCSFKRTRS